MRKDEAQIAYGFAKYLRDALHNASFIGFTGTPVGGAQGGGSGSFQIFGSQDEKGYLHKYSIIESIDDETTRTSLRPDAVPSGISLYKSLKRFVSVDAAATMLPRHAKMKIRTDMFNSFMRRNRLLRNSRVASGRSSSPTSKSAPTKWST